MLTLEMIQTKYDMVIGLEVHAQLKTRSKLMSAARNVYAQPPNTSVSTICTGMPGALPVVNWAAVHMAIKTAFALEAHIPPLSVFSRKHYFYPDLPKGYQISQYDRPYAEGGAVTFYFQGQLKKVALVRIHMEEDAGKNLHFDERGISLVDLNRSSVPLLEIVSQPDMTSPAEAVAYLKALRLVLRYLDVCDGNLEEGNFRCDANISLKPKGQTKLGTRVELKNINSFRNLERALLYEVDRQFKALEMNETIHQETRLWDAEKNASHLMRSKEEASDYRYMPEPDLLPLFLSDELTGKLKKELPELPLTKQNRFIKDYGRTPYDAEVLCASQALANYYETVAKKTQDSQLASTFIQTNVLAEIKDIEKDFEHFYPTAEALAELLLKIKDGTLSLNLAKEVLEIMKNEKKTAQEIIQERNLSQITDETALLNVIEKVIAENPKQLADYQAGKDKLFGFFMGQCQKALQGKGHPQQLKTLLEKKLNKK